MAMDFKLDSEHEMARGLFREFAEKEVKPLAKETDEQELFPRETVDKMQKLGFMGIPIERKYGGQGCDTLTYVLAVEEISKVCATTGVIVSAHTSLGCDPLRKFGTEEQKEKYLRQKAGSFRADGAGSRNRCRWTADEGGASGRPLCTERKQDIHHQRWTGRCVYHICDDR